jgi:hypothetical protein
MRGGRLSVSYLRRTIGLECRDMYNLDESRFRRYLDLVGRDPVSGHSYTPSVWAPTYGIKAIVQLGRAEVQKSSLTVTCTCRILSTSFLFHLFWVVYFPPFHMNKEEESRNVRFEAQTSTKSTTLYSVASPTSPSIPVAPCHRIGKGNCQEPYL